MKDEGIGLMRAMALIGVVASLASAVEPVSSRDNLIRNGNFEQHSAKHIPGWQAVQHNDRYDIDIDTKVRHGGAAGLRLTWKGGADARTNFNIAQFSVVQFPSASFSQTAGAASSAAPDASSSWAQTRLGNKSETRATARIRRRMNNSISGLCER